MFGLFTKPSLQSDEIKGDRPQDEEKVQAVCKKIISIISPQIEAIGLRVGDIGPECDAASGMSRGYIFGLCIYLAKMHGIERESDAFSALIVWAFDEIYDKLVGFHLLRDTMDRHSDGDPHVMSGMISAYKDIIYVMERNEWPHGFSDCASGGSYSPE